MLYSQYSHLFVMCVKIALILILALICCQRNNQITNNSHIFSVKSTIKKEQTVNINYLRNGVFNILSAFFQKWEMEHLNIRDCWYYKNFGI